MERMRGQERLDNATIREFLSWIFDSAVEQGGSYQNVRYRKISHFAWIKNRGEGQEVVFLSSEVQLLKQLLSERECAKEWYSTAEVAELMGVSQYTVRERWCNSACIDCEKDPATGKWRISCAEYERLKRGGKLRKSSLAS